MTKFKTPYQCELLHLAERARAKVNCAMRTTYIQYCLNINNLSFIISSSYDGTGGLARHYFHSVY